MPNALNATTTALIAKLAGDATLTAAMPDGVYYGDGPAHARNFVLVDLLDGDDEPMLGGGRAWTDLLFLVKAVSLGDSALTANAAAERIDDLLENGSLTIPGFSLMTMRRTSPVRALEVDGVDRSIRWQHAGGTYQVMVSA